MASEVEREDRKKSGRKGDRVSVSMPVNLASTACLTRDISASGAFLEANAPFVTGDKIDFSIEFDSPGGKLILKCIGEVVRVEEQNGKTGVAVRIIDSIMESAEGSIDLSSSSINDTASTARKVSNS